MQVEVGCTSARHWVVGSGFLDKCRDGAVRVGWSRRFFVLSPTALFYYRRTDTRNELFGEERGRFPLTEILEVQFQADEYDPAHPFYNIIIKLQRRETQPLRLRSDSRLVAESWIRMIEEVRELNQKMKQAPLCPSPERQVPDANTLGFRLMSVVPQGVGMTLDENRVNILATSYLEKARDGAVRSGWAVRFFVLTHTSLVYHRRSDPRRELCGEERGKILVADIQNAEFNQSGIYFNIEITTARKDAKKMLVLRTQHQSLWDEWKAALQNVVESSGRLSADSRGSPYSPSVGGTPAGGSNVERGNSFTSRARATSSPKSVMDVPEVPAGAPQVVAYSVKTNHVETVAGYRVLWGTEITVDFPSKGTAAANLVLSDGGIAKIDQSVIAQHATSAQSEFKVSLANNGKLRLSCRPGVVAPSSLDDASDDIDTGGIIAAVKQALWGAVSGSFIAAVAVLVQAEMESTTANPNSATVYLVSSFGLILALYVLLANTVLGGESKAAEATDKKTRYHIKLLTWEPPAGYLPPNASTPMSLAVPRRFSGTTPMSKANQAAPEEEEDPGYMKTNVKFPPVTEKGFLMTCTDFPKHIVLGESIDP
jgi:hypothetical protein